MEPSFLSDLFGPAFDRMIGPAFQGALEPSSFRPCNVSAVRPLQPDDEPAVERFCVECGREDWDYSALEKAKHYRTAHFEGERIVAMAGYRPWTAEAGDPCLLTHPSYRGRGWGLAVASAVVKQALDEGKMLLYQTLESNHGAVKIALRLGYEQHARHMAVRLKTEAP
jgi:GNAT superfamily N-acetyltransferase